MGSCCLGAPEGCPTGPARCAGTSSAACASRLIASPLRPGMRRAEQGAENKESGSTPHAVDARPGLYRRTSREKITHFLVVERHGGVVRRVGEPRARVREVQQRPLSRTGIGAASMQNTVVEHDRVARLRGRKRHTLTIPGLAGAVFLGRAVAAMSVREELRRSQLFRHIDKRYEDGNAVRR